MAAEDSGRESTDSSETPNPQTLAPESAQSFYYRAAVALRLACSPPIKANRFNPRPGHSRIFACGNRAGRCRWLAGFLCISRFPGPCIPALLHTHLNHPHRLISLSRGSQDLAVTSRPNLFTLYSRNALEFVFMECRAKSSTQNYLIGTLVRMSRTILFCAAARHALVRAVAWRSFRNQRVTAELCVTAAVNISASTRATAEMQRPASRVPDITILPADDRAPQWDNQLFLRVSEEISAALNSEVLRADSSLWFAWLETIGNCVHDAFPKWRRSSLLEQMDLIVEARRTGRDPPVPDRVAIMTRALSRNVANIFRDEEAASSGTIPTCENPGVTRLGLELGSLWWVASSLTAKPPRPLVLKGTTIGIVVLPPGWRCWEGESSAQPWAVVRDSSVGKMGSALECQPVSRDCRLKPDDCHARTLAPVLTRHTPLLSSPSL
ncbi:hypothetical protein PR048_002532 [Dryococelus australis]|uniref:Uncharacterized protein n=1 Tax=Dryococelus australis TaxID=614101 RepID=A0ABQ9ILI0_9NEOP|nr:hypothetical protein PR048_002532 [Dryococelus australis]